MRQELEKQNHRGRNAGGTQELFKFCQSNDEEGKTVRKPSFLINKLNMKHKHYLK